MACIINFKDKKYNYEEFASMLVSGELNKMISQGLIDKSKLTGDMSVLSEGAMPGKPADQFSKLEGEEAENKKKERSAFKYFEDAQNALPKSKYSKEEIEEIVKNGDFTVLTGENPMGDVYSDPDNAKLNEEAEKFLKEKGYDYIPVAGKYGQTEHSFLVPNMSKKHAMEFALMFNQDSVLTPDGLIYQNMQTNDRLKSDDAFGIDVSKEDVDYATAIRLNDGNLFGFKVGVDFSKEGKANQEYEQAMTEAKGEETTGKRGISSSRDLRGTLDRLFGDLDATTRQAIEADPEAYIDPLKINEAKAKFGVLTDQDLMSYLSTSGIRILSLDPASNLGLMAKIEAIKRAQNSPDKKFEGVPLSALLVDAAKIGSVGGRILVMMRELGTINPTTYADLIIKMIESTGAVLSDKNKDTIRLLSSDVISTSAKETSAHQQFNASPTRANQLSLIEAKKEAKLAIDELAKVIEAQMPVSVAKSFISNLQGNLLQIESLGVNLTSTTIGGGLLFLPKAIAKTGVSMFRVGIGKTFNTNGHNIAEIGYLSGLKYYIKAFAPAASKSLSILANGTDSEINAAKGEFRSSLKPLNLLNILFNSEQYGRRVKGSKEYDYRLSGGQYQVFDVKNPLVSVHTFNDEQAAKRKAFEMSNPLDWTNTGKYILKTVTGLAPEAMFRVINATDTLIRDPNTAYINAMFGKRIGLSGQDLASFVFEPNPEYMKHLEYQAAKTVFQENRKGTQIITSALKDLEDISDSNILASALNVVVRTSMPYVKTPANIVSQYVNYALPFIPMYRAINAYSKAYSTNSESERNIHLNDAEESMSIALVGFGMWAAYTMLALGGLATAGYDHYDDDEKDIMLKNNIPYSSINVTAVKRMMDGGPIEAQPSDEFIAIKYFGLPGMVVQMHANRIQKAKSEAIKNGKVFNGDNDISMTSKFFEMFSVPDVMGTAFDQCFAAGINTIFGVMRDPESKTVHAARGYAQALVAGFGVPATLSKYMEAEYVPNLTDKSSAVKTARNVFMYRIAGITDGIPSKIDVFGRKLKTYTPEGKDPKIYNTFYPFKIKKSGTDKIDYMLYQTYLQSKDPAVIPSKYQQQDIMGASKALEVSGFRPTPADVEILNIDRGQRRLQHLIEVMESGYFPFIDQNGDVEEADSFDKLPIKDRVAYIKNAYKAADQEHITEFRDDYINKIAKGLGAKFKQEEE